MVKLADQDIKTREVLEWKGVHILHHPLSSCSQKVRIYLNLKKIPWHTHVVDVMHNANISVWFLGINPRGLVPVLVHDGDVHIESNDILLYLERAFPSPCLIQNASEANLPELLRHEDDLHLDLRSLSVRFVFDPPAPPKTSADLAQYDRAGSGTVNGARDTRKDQEIQYWSRYAAEGVSDSTVRTAAARFQKAFSTLDGQLRTTPYLLGDALTVLDIAWFIYVNRLAVAGYPVARLHPRLAAWFDQLLARPEFLAEISPPAEFIERVNATQTRHRTLKQTLSDVAGLV